MFKHFNEGQVNSYSFRVHKTHSLSNSDLTRHQFLSASAEPSNLSSSYYHFARINFYLSGSEVGVENPTFNNYATPGNQFDGENIFLSKFYETGSIVYIPQSKFGDGIKKGSFTLNDTVTGAEIVDDSNGNLYATNATEFRDASVSISSSDNYVGNLFYDIGVFTITETASFSSTKDYSDVTSGNYSIRYQGSHEINTNEYVCELQPNEFNETQNVTIYKTNGNGKFKDNLTSSYWPNYITEVGLYDDEGELVAISRLSKAIPKSTKIPMRFFVRMDY